MGKETRIEYAWNGMRGSNCDRMQKSGLCDYHKDKAHDNCYCRDYIPRESLSKRTILDMWSSHSQRWIREGQ